MSNVGFCPKVSWRRFVTKELSGQPTDVGDGTMAAKVRFLSCEVFSPQISFKEPGGQPTRVVDAH